MNIEFLSTVALIAPDPPVSRMLYVDVLGLRCSSSSESGAFAPLPDPEGLQQPDHPSAVGVRLPCLSRAVWL